MFHARERAAKRSLRAIRAAADSRLLAACAGLASGVGFALAVPRVGAWSILFLLPVFFGAGFLLGQRTRAAQNRDAMDALKAQLAHEINNPLSILIDQLGLAVDALERTTLAQGSRRVPELRLLANEALAAASRISRVVRELDKSTPISIERPNPVLIERPTPAKSGPIPKPIRARILVIDDEPQVAASLRRLLYRHDVTVATSGFEAQGLLQSQRFDVIVSDVMMPEPSGLDVFERLTRTQPDLARRFIFVTGGTYTERARDLLASIPNVRLGKPVDAMALDRAIAEIHQGLEPNALTHA